MREITRATITDTIGFLVEFVAMVLLGTVGLLAERAGLSHLTTGFDPVAFWLIGVGALALYASVYLIGYQRLLPRLRATVDPR